MVKMSNKFTCGIGIADWQERINRAVSAAKGIVVRSVFTPFPPSPKLQE